MDRTPDTPRRGLTPRRVLTLLLGLLPAGRVKNWLLGLANPGWRLARDARIEPVLLFGVARLEAGAQSRIGFGSVLRDLRLVQLGPAATIGHWNWITSALVLHGLDEQAGTLRLERDAAVTSRHYLDCSGGITIRAFATVAGVRSTLITHQIDLERSRQTVRGIEIGPFTLIGSNVRMTPGSRVPARCLIGMGAVVTGRLREEQALYAGVPAEVRRRLPDGEYYHRAHGWVGI